MAEFTPYTTGASLFGAKPTWLANPLDQQRLQSYDLYERIYWNVRDTFKVQMRGSNDLPIYIPTGRTIVDTMNRYTMPDIKVTVYSRTDPTNRTPDVQAAEIALRDLWARENFKAKFAGAKRYGIMRGDWVWHVYGNAAKPLGSRISITAIDPSMYFPVMDPTNIDKRIAVKLALPVIHQDKARVQMQLYRKLPATATADGGVTVEEGIYEPNEWESTDLDNLKPVEVLRAKTLLPPAITEIPVYHIKNFDEPGNPFGSSEIRGLEDVMAAVNQTVSDEDLALALEGIGMYTTDAPKPINPVTRQEMPWQLGPGRVIHRPANTRWERVQGISSVAPYGDHFNRLWDGLKRASSSPDVAVGTVDVQIAQSGIALALQLSPILAKAIEKNDLGLGVLDQMFFDILTMWMAAYEETVFTEVGVKCIPGSAVPEDRETKFKELELMLANKVISRKFYRSEVAKLGYVFPDDIEEQIAEDSSADTAASDRLLLEAGPGTGTPEPVL